MNLRPLKYLKTPLQWPFKQPLTTLKWPLKQPLAAFKYLKMAFETALNNALTKPFKQPKKKGLRK